MTEILDERKIKTILLKAPSFGGTPPMPDSSGAGASTKGPPKNQPMGSVEPKQATLFGPQKLNTGQEASGESSTFKFPDDGVYCSEEEPPEGVQKLYTPSGVCYWRRSDEKSELSTLYQDDITENDIVSQLGDETKNLYDKNILSVDSDTGEVQIRIDYDGTNDEEVEDNILSEKVEEREALHDAYLEDGTALDRLKERASQKNNPMALGLFRSSGSARKQKRAAKRRYKGKSDFGPLDLLAAHFSYRTRNLGRGSDPRSKQARASRIGRHMTREQRQKTIVNKLENVQNERAMAHLGLRIPTKWFVEAQEKKLDLTTPRGQKWIASKREEELRAAAEENREPRFRIASTIASMGQAGRRVLDDEEKTNVKRTRARVRRSRARRMDAEALETLQNHVDATDAAFKSKQEQQLQERTDAQREDLRGKGRGPGRGRAGALVGESAEERYTKRVAESLNRSKSTEHIKELNTWYHKNKDKLDEEQSEYFKNLLTISDTTKD